VTPPARWKGANSEKTMIETDYLVVGAGASGLIFADEMLTHSDARIVLVDRRDRPGGHWTEAYPFVRLHQPSVFYGAGSRALGSTRIETSGPNAGFFQQASGAEISAYFEQLLHERLLPSGRVEFLPLHEYRGDWSAENAVVSFASGRTEEIRARSGVVDTTFYRVTTPASHQPSFEAVDGVRLVAPARLPQLVAPGRRYVVIGGGKTSMDTAGWLLGNGVPADSVTWIVPRDSWLINRATIQPGRPGSTVLLDSVVNQLEAAAEAQTVDELYDRLERADQLLRIDVTIRPQMFHGATISHGELNVLRRVKNVVREGRLRRIDRGMLHLERDEVAADPDALYVDCTARGITWSPVRPVFEGKRITVQFVREGRISLSAAAIAFVAATVRDEAHRNRLCRPIPYEERLVTWPRAMLAELQNGEAWSKDGSMRAWARQHRLAGIGRFPGDEADPTIEALRSRIRQLRPKAVENLTRLVETVDAADAGIGASPGPSVRSISFAA
jgi:hypothetical protein